MVPQSQNTLIDLVVHLRSSTAQHLRELLPSQPHLVEEVLVYSPLIRGDSLIFTLSDMHLEQVQVVLEGELVEGYQPGVVMELFDILEGRVEFESAASMEVLVL